MTILREGTSEGCPFPRIWVKLQAAKNQPMSTNSLVRNAGPLWDEATRSPFLDAAATGRLEMDAFGRWLAQDCLFAKDLMAFQAILLAKAPRDCHKPQIGGLAALDKEIDWFESSAARLQVDLDNPPHQTCRRYTDFLMRCAYMQPYEVLLAILFGVEASYHAAWSALVPSGRYAESIALVESEVFCVCGRAGRTCRAVSARGSAGAFQRSARTRAGLLADVMEGLNAP
jgi:thiaminase